MPLKMNRDPQPLVRLQFPMALFMGVYQHPYHRSRSDETGQGNGFLNITSPVVTSTPYRRLPPGVPSSP